jgi:hypothetical protein
MKDIEGIIWLKVLTECLRSRHDKSHLVWRLYERGEETFDAESIQDGTKRREEKWRA